MSPARRLATLALALLVTGSVAWPALAAEKSKRFGIEGRIVRFEKERDVLVVNVVKTKVSGGFGGGGVAGDPAPGSVKNGAELAFAVVPEGSVLKRTVVKSVKGGGLNDGTRASFLAALKAIPSDRNVVFSFEKNPKGQPEWLLKMIQIRMTQEELDKRLAEITVEE
jgi:hypothetical protein